MLDSASKYDFTNCPANIATGRSFGYGVCPRLEQWLWLHEMVRTIEARGSFLPGAGSATYADGGGKVDAFAMWSELPTLRSWLDRVNAVQTVPDYSIATGQWSAYNTYSRHSSPDYPIDAARGLSNAEVRAMITSTPRNGFSVDFRMCPFRDSLQMRSLCTGGLTRSALLQAVGVRSRVQGFGSVVGASGGGWRRNGSYTGVRPEDDWSTLTRVDGRRVGVDTNIEPFLGMNPGVLYSPSHTAAFYYRVKHTGSYDGTIAGCDYTYSYEPSSWVYAIADGPWTHNRRGNETAWDSAVSVIPVYAVYAAALWNNASVHTGSIYVDQIINTWFYVFDFNVVSTGNIWIHRNGATTTVELDGQSVKGVGDAVCAAVGVENMIRAIGPDDAIPDPVSRIGYAVYVEPCWAFLTGTPASRDIDN